MSAKFIVMEGLDGSGKSTQLMLLAAGLRSLGRRVAVTAEPTDSALGGLIRDALSGCTPRTDSELAALFLADRIAHNVNPVWGIEKLLGDGCDVICDRYYHSSLAYQGARTDADWVFSMNLRCPDIRRPDLCLFLYVDPESAAARMDGARTHTEIYEHTQAQRQTADAYDTVLRRLEAEGERICRIDASRNPDAVANEVFEAVRALL